MMQSRTLRVSIAAGAALSAIALTMSAAPADATYDGQTGRIAFGAFTATDRTQADIWSVNPNGQYVHRLTDASGT